MSRFTEDLVLAEPGEPPKTLSALVGRLGVFAAAEDVKRAAVNAWLRDHEPTTRMMRDQMTDHGYLPVDQRHAA